MINVDKFKEIVKNPLFGCVICIIIFIAAVMNSNASEKNTADTMALEYPTSEITIQSNQNVREYGSIRTYTFDIIDVETGEVCGFSKGTIDTEDIESKLTEHLKLNNFKVKSIGMVKDQFYIQQDTSIETDRHAGIKMIRLKDGFTASDFFALTEAVYNETEVDADSIIRHNLDGTEESHLYYMYTYTEKVSDDNNVDVTVPLETSTETQP